MREAKPLCKPNRVPVATAKSGVGGATLQSDLQGKATESK